MKKNVQFFFVACLGSFISLFSAYLFFYFNNNVPNHLKYSLTSSKNILPVLNNGNSSSSIIDFTLPAEKSLPAVVHIKTSSEQINNLSYDPFADWFFGQQKRQQGYTQQGSGSGVIISDNGYIVTNNHVISGADKIEVTLNDKRSYVARIIGFDASTDVALIKIEQKGLPFLLYGNSDLVKIGEWVLAVGNPFNLNSTVTAGIISAKGRNNILDNNKRPIESFIQTDAAVNPGNSGGALVNTNGDLIGINTAIASNNGTYQGYSFAVPVNIVKKVISDLIEFGSVQRAFIGISIKDIDSKFASDKNINQLNGVYVNGINNGGSAEDAGIKEGDIITKIQDINVGSVSELQEQISRYRPGDKIIIALLRNNKPIEITLTLKNLNNTTSLIKKTESLTLSMPSVGAEFTQMKPEDLAKFGFENGIMITKLYSGKLSLVGIKEGFIITSIDKKKILVIEELKRIFDDKKGLILIEGFYTNGVKATYSFNL